MKLFVSRCFVLMSRSFVFFLLAIALLLPRGLFAANHAWVTPTPEELKMTSIPQVPGASAVVLDYEEVDDDIHLHQHSYYARIKILTEKGKEWADVELGYGSGFSTQDDYFTSDYNDIAGRTIHSDGTIIPFTGKPYVKTLTRNADYKISAKVFTLPDVQVGSIIEFHYTFHFPENYAESPSWQVQRELFIRHEHFQFYGSAQYVLVDHGDSSPVIQWATNLPKGVDVQHSAITPDEFSLEMHDVMPIPDEPYMPPRENFTQHVTFYYSAYSSVDKFWKGEGKYHAKSWDKFIGPNSGVSADVSKLTTPSDTQQVKLKKIYDAVEAIDNTDFSREHSKQEDESAGKKTIDNTDDVLQLKHGNSRQITFLFIAMARAAGLKAYAMEVTNRSQRYFIKNLPEWDQLTDYIAIVNVDGKEQFFDPGSRYCPFGELNWRHSDSGGVRQLDGETAIAVTPFMDYKQSSVKRIAVLNVDKTGNATGTLQIFFTGAPALDWRQTALRGDSTSLNKDLEESVSSMLPGGMDVKVRSVDGLTDTTQPLLVILTASGPVGTVTGKRILLLGDIYNTNEKPLLTEAKRTQSMTFNYASTRVDLVKYQLPATITVDTLPDKQSFNYKNYAAYSYTASQLPGNAVLINRQYALANYIYLLNEYADTRDFLNKVTQADQQVTLLKQGAASNAN